LQLIEQLQSAWCRFPAIFSANHQSELRGPGKAGGEPGCRVEPRVCGEFGLAATFDQPGAVQHVLEGSFGRRDLAPFRDSRSPTSALKIVTRMAATRGAQDPSVGQCQLAVSAGADAEVIAIRPVV